MLFFVLALAQVAFSAEQATGCCAVADNFEPTTVLVQPICTIEGTVTDCTTIDLDGTTTKFTETGGVCSLQDAAVTATNCGATSGQVAGVAVTGTLTPAETCADKLAEEDVCTDKDGTNDWTMTGMMTLAGCCGTVAENPAEGDFVAGTCMCAAGELDVYKMLSSGAATPVDTMTCGDKELASKATCSDAKATYADQCCTSGEKAAGLDKDFDPKMRMMVTMYYSDDACTTLFKETGVLSDTTACTAAADKFNKVSTLDTCLVLTTTQYDDDACATATDGVEPTDQTPTATCTAEGDLFMKQELLCEPVVVTTEEPAVTTAAGDSTAMLSALLVMIAAVLKY